jgi:uncharacterized membrane protein YhdT
MAGNLPKCYSPGTIDGPTMKICKWYDSQCCLKPNFPMLICVIILKKIKPDYERIEDAEEEASSN